MISPGEAARKNDELHAEQLIAAEKHIDSVLARSYASGYSVSIDRDNIPIKDYKLRDQLIARYKRAGWKVEHFTDQRDCEDKYIFTAARKP